MSTGPAPEGVTNEIFALTKTITKYKICPDITVNLDKVGSQSWTVDGKDFAVEVVDSVQDYMELMKEVFDFSLLRQMISLESGPKLRILIDCMNGGNYCQRKAGGLVF